MKDIIKDRLHNFMTVKVGLNLGEKIKGATK